MPQYNERKKIKQHVVLGIGPNQRWSTLDLSVDIWQYPDRPITNRQMRNALRTKLNGYLMAAYPEDGS